MSKSKKTVDLLRRSMFRVSLHRASIRSYARSKFQTKISKSINDRQNIYLEAFPGTGKTTAILDELSSRTGFSRGINKLIIVSRTGRANSISERISDRSDTGRRKIGKLLARDPATRRKRDSFIETIQNVENKPILIAQIAGNSRINKG